LQCPFYGKDGYNDGESAWFDSGKGTLFRNRFNHTVLCIADGTTPTTADEGGIYGAGSVLSQAIGSSGTGNVQAGVIRNVNIFNNAAQGRSSGSDEDSSTSRGHNAK
jgi:hypothetical protein